MRPIFHPSLVNGRCGDPTIYVETLFEKHSLLFDVGEIASLSARKIRRVDQIFVSHAHIDHFVGFDHLLRLLVGHERTIHLYGPTGFAERVFHKLQAYRWNLVENYPCDLVFAVSELETQNSMSTTRFRLKRAFAAEPLVSRKTLAGVLCDEPTHRVSAAILEHGTPCLAFALREAAHVNIWKNRLSEHGLPVGPWLRSLKQAIVERRADDHLIRIDGSATSDDRLVPLGSLRDLVTVTAARKLPMLPMSPTRRPIVPPSQRLFRMRTFSSSRRHLRRPTSHWQGTGPILQPWLQEKLRGKPMCAASSRFTSLRAMRETRCGCWPR
jgi:ribonuclease Z